MHKKVNKNYIKKQIREIGEIEISICSALKDVNHFMNAHFVSTVRSEEDLEESIKYYKKNSDNHRHQYCIWVDDEDETGE